MKKIMIFMALFLYMFFIVSCKEETKITLNANQFESIYDISFETTFEDETFKVVAKFEPKYNFKVIDGELEFSVYLRSYDLDTIHVIEKNKKIAFNEISSIILRESIDEDIMLIEMYDYAIINSNLTIETSDNIFINERTYEIPSMTSYPLWFSIEHPVKNNEIYQEIIEKQNAFQSNHNQFEFETFTSILLDDGNDIIDLSIEQQMLLQVSPFYLDINTEGIHQIITEMNELIVMILLPTEPDSYGYYRYSPIDLGLTSEDLNPSEDISFDPSMMRFTKLNNRLYHFISKASDYFTEEDIVEIEALYGNETTQLIKNIYIQGQIEFSSQYMMFTYGFSMGDEQQQMKMIMSMKMTKTTFIPIDFLDSNQYKLQAPTYIDFASITSPINEKIDGLMDGSGLYYRFELDEGSYVIESESNYFGGVQYRLYNENYEEIYLGILDDKTSMKSLGVDHEYLIVQNPGIYYLKVSYAFYNQMFSFKLSKLDMDLLDHEHGILMSNDQELSFELINSYDTYTVVFNIDQITAVKITGADIPYILAKPYLHQEFTRFFMDSSTRYFVITPEHPTLVFMNSDIISKKIYNLSFNLISQTHTTSKDESKMEDVTNLYTMNEVITGPGISKTYMRLIVSSEARYQFIFDNMYGILEGTLYNHSFTSIANIYQNTSVDLLPGTYYIEFSNSYVSIGKVKYTKIDLDIEIIDHELELIPSPVLTNQSVSIIHGVLEDSLNRIYYQFTLNEMSYVIMSKGHSLYNSQNQKISFDKIPYGTVITYQLEADTYMVKINEEYEDFPQDYNLFIAKIENPYVDDNHFGLNITRAYLNISYEMKADYIGDRDILKLVITERGNYIFHTNMSLVLCNENGVNINTVNPLWSGHTITLDPGTYYFINYPFVNDVWTFRITT